MKKTQVALAALALVASTAALADGVTVYGTLDTSVAKSTAGSNTFDGTGNWGTSLFGIKGSEDLGNGMTAAFNLEGGISAGTGGPANNGVTTGTTAILGAGTLFSRAANVSLTTGAGTIGLGTQFSPFVGAALGGDVSGNVSFFVPMLIVAGGNTAQMFGAGGNDNNGVGASPLSGGFFIPNAITYTTPNISGLDATVMTQRAAGVREDAYTALRVSYAFGAAKINYGYQRRGGSNAALNSNGLNNYKSSAITGTYQLSDEITIGAGWYSNDDLDGASTSTGAPTKTSAMSAGVSYAVNSATKVSINYASNDTAAAKASILNLGLRHDLSKRTYVYGTISNTQNGASPFYSGRNVREVAGFDETLNQTGYAVGVGHNF